MLGMPAEVGTVGTRYVCAASAIAFVRARITNANTVRHQAMLDRDEGDADLDNALEFDPEPHIDVGKGHTYCHMYVERRTCI